MVTEVLKKFSSNGKEMSKEDMKKYFKDLVGAEPLASADQKDLEDSFTAWYNQIDLDKDGKVTQLELACYLQKNLVPPQEEKD